MFGLACPLAYNPAMSQARSSANGRRKPWLAVLQRRPSAAGWLGLFLAALLLVGCRAKPSLSDLPTPTPLPLATPTECTASLQVESDPSGVSLYLDDTLAGQTPIEVTVSPGQHTLRLESEGYAPATILTDARCGQRMQISETLRDRSAPSVILAPFRAVVAPQEGLKIAARAEDNGSVAHMTLWVDDTQVLRVDEASLRHNLDTRALAPGPHRIRVEARDAAGNAGEATGTFELVDSSDALAVTPTLEPTRSAPVSGTPEATVTGGRATIPAPTPTQNAVQISQDTVSIATYGYSQALYTAQQEMGHPYPLLADDWERSVALRDYGVIVLRNKVLELTILPELGGEFRKSVEATEEMLSLMLPHDVLIWVAWCDAKTARASNAALQREFKTWADDCTFLPYWEAQDVIRGQDDTLVASAYVREKSALLIVSNWSDEPRQARLTLDWAALTGGKPMRSVRVLLGKGAAQLAGNTLSVDVPARNLRLVVLD